MLTTLVRSAVGWRAVDCDAVDFAEAVEQSCGQVGVMGVNRFDRFRGAGTRSRRRGRRGRAGCDCRARTCRAARRAGGLRRSACRCRRSGAVRVRARRPGGCRARRCRAGRAGPCGRGRPADRHRICATSIGTWPSDWAASTRNSASVSRTMRPISSIGWIAPVTFEAWITATSRVLGRMAARTSSGETKPWPSHGT